jgi:TonB family protein
MQGNILRTLFVIALTGSICAASVTPTLRPGDHTTSSLASREYEAWARTLHDPDLTSALHTRAQVNCEASAPAEPLATPNPLLDIVDPSSRVEVSFIIGTDGHVYSPLILESAGPVEDRTILDAVRAWRYRPATCNGAATETEAKIEFSSR